MSVLAAFMVPHPPMIVPEIGQGSEQRIEATIRAYQQVAEEISALKPETIIITSPHVVMYNNYFHISPGAKARGSFADFRVPQVSFEETYDEELIHRICLLAQKDHFPAGTQGERDPRLDHGTMVPLWFIRQKYTDFRLVRAGLSGLTLKDHYLFGQMIRQAAEEEGRKVILVASGDLSHKLQEYGPYGFAPEGPVYDERIMDVCGRAAFKELFSFDRSFCERAAECGHRSFVIMAGAFDGMAVKPTVLSHEDVTGVGYGICTFYPQGKDENRHFLQQLLAEKEKDVKEKALAADEYVQLARQSLEYYIRNGKMMEMPEGVPENLRSERAGAFVSIHKGGRLRGCIGTIAATQDSVAEEIIHNAVSAGTRDPRFDPITEDELKWLEINVDVLGKPEEVFSVSELDARRYGVIVTSGYKRGLLLPDLEGVDTPEQQIAIARKKGGIREDERITLERFEVVRHT